MYWILSCLLILVLMFLLKRKRNLIPLLSVRIDTTDGFKFQAKFTLLNNEIKSIEYVRLCLHFIAKMLLLAKGDDKSMIRSFLHKIGESKSFEVGMHDFKEDVSILTELDEFPVNSSSIVATLYYENMQSRVISTKVPWRILEDQFFASIVSLLVISLPKLDEYQKKILHIGIRNLSRYYYANLKDNSIKSSRVFPNDAFNEAVLLQ